MTTHECVFIISINIYVYVHILLLFLNKFQNQYQPYSRFDYNLYGDSNPQCFTVFHIRCDDCWEISQWHYTVAGLC